MPTGDAAVVRRWDGTPLQYRMALAKELLGVRWNREGTPDDSGDDTKDVRSSAPLSSSSLIREPGPIPCYATGHGHPPVPGPWMTEAHPGACAKADHEIARSVNPKVAMSCEGAPPEIYLKDFQIWDARASKLSFVLIPIPRVWKVIQASIPIR